MRLLIARSLLPLWIPLWTSDLIFILFCARQTYSVCVHVCTYNKQTRRDAAQRWVQRVTRLCYLSCCFGTRRYHSYMSVYIMCGVVYLRNFIQQYWVSDHRILCTLYGCSAYTMNNNTLQWSYMKLV